MTEEVKAEETTETTVADTTGSQGEQPQVKTFTADEVDAKIKARIDKQNARHAEELAKISDRVKELEERSAAAEAERDALKAKQEIAEQAGQVAAEYGVPISLLHGETLEQVKQSAEALAAYKKELLASVGAAPVVRDSGKPRTGEKTNAELFGEFMSQNFGN